MVRLSLCALALAALYAPRARAELPAAPHRYALEARLDEARREVVGRVRIRFENTGTVPLDSLLFHLYLNAFRDADSVFMRESGGRLRGEHARGAGELRLASLRVGGEDVLARSERELVPGDRTQLRAPLPAPLAPGAAVEIESDFVAVLPPVFARSGYAGSFYAVAQWFPKLAKLEREGRFASFPYHALGEFYADFADYTLTLDLPADLAVVASGAELADEPKGARRLHRFEARHVHDVAFVAARGFREDQEEVDGVRVRYLSPPGYGWALPEHARVVRAGLGHFGRLFGAYPYPTLSVVLPPRTADGAAGMEYPTLFISESAFMAGLNLPSLTGPFVTAHELAHQWFHGLLASDEVRHPVLDEGLAQWASLDLVRELYGPREGIGPIVLDRYEVVRVLSTRIGPRAPPGLAAPAYTPAEYAHNVYGRAALALESIRRAHGRVRFERALARYAEASWLGHPDPATLERAFDAAYGAGFAERVLRPLLFAGADASVRITEARTGGRDGRYLTRVRARRGGAVALPTWLALYGVDGSELARVRFPAEDESLLVTIETRARVARALLDPDRALLLDARADDQEVTFARAPEQPLVARLVALVQLALSAVGP